MSQVPEPAPATAVVTGVVDRVILHRPDTGYTVLRLKTADGAAPILVGTMPQAEPGELLRAEGAWYDDRVWGRQFRAASIQLEPPTSEEGLTAYLAAGRVRGLGEIVARRLVERFGTGLGRIIEDEPERLKEVAGVGAKLIARLRAAWVDQRANRDLLVFLAGHGIGGARAAAILDTFGTTARERMTADPYVLAREIRGIGFRTADAVAMKLGVPPTSPLRVGAALGQVLREAADDGHTALPHAEAMARLRDLLGGAHETVGAALDAELQSGRLVARIADQGPVLMLGELDAAESAVAGRLRELALAAPAWPEVDAEVATARAEAALGVALAGAQAAAIREALCRRVLIVTGGPGTGKTTIVRGILAALADAAPDVLLAAPTGRAARRLAESTGREARTLHRLLEADPERGFRRNAQRPLEGDLVVVDEVSMVDTWLMAALLAALPPDAALLLVGDVDQLPSIGPGQVLADLIGSAALPTIRLAEVFRQAAESGIVRAAHRINRGELPAFARTDDTLSDFYGIRVDDPADAAAKLVELVASRIPERFGLDPFTDVQVLTPVHRGPLGTRALNEALQARLNPAPTAVLVRGGARYAIGDKVMQLENDYDREVYNGDLGRITAADPETGSVEVGIDGRTLGYTGEEIDRLGPAFAVTVHKAQGSEYPAVVIPLLREHGRMLRRDLLYTAITRARRLVVLLTEPDALERAVRTASSAARVSLLRRRLAGLEVR